VLEEVQKKALHKGTTIVLGRCPTLRIIPSEIRTLHHRRLFSGLGRARPGLESLSTKLDKMFEEVGKAHDLNPGQPWPRLVNLMLVSDFEKIIYFQWPWDCLATGDPGTTLKHLETFFNNIKDWILRRNLRLYLIKDEMIKKRGDLCLLTRSWDTTAVVSTRMAIKRSLDFAVFYCRDAGETKQIKKPLEELMKPRFSIKVDPNLLDSYLKLGQHEVEKKAFLSTFGGRPADCSVLDQGPRSA
jgi:hypothetical protein